MKKLGKSLANTAFKMVTTQVLKSTIQAASSILKDIVINKVNGKYYIEYSFKCKYTFYKRSASQSFARVLYTLEESEYGEVRYVNMVYCILYYIYTKFYDADSNDNKNNIAFDENNAEAMILSNIISNNSMSIITNGCVIKYSMIDLTKPEEDPDVATIKLSFYGPNAKEESEEFISIVQTLYNNNKDRIKAIYDNSKKLQKGVITENTTLAKYVQTEVKDIDNIFNPCINTLVNKLNLYNNDTEYYTRHNIKHNLRILLYGVPGTGKTSICDALGLYVSKNFDHISRVCILKPNILSEKLLMEIKDACGKMYVMEEIDTSIVNREVEYSDQDKSYKEKIQVLGYLLELLDGTYTPNDSIFIATTNHIENIDPALLRRFDYVEHIGNIDKEYATRLIENLEADPEDVLQHIDQDKDGNYNPDKIQKYILSNRNK